EAGDDLESAVELDHAEAVGHLAAVPRGFGQHRREELQASTRSDRSFDGAFRGAVGADRRGGKMRLAACPTLRGQQTGSLRAVDEASVAGFARRGFGQWAVRLATDGALVGFCGLRETGVTDEVEVLYGIAPAVWGHGFATEAVRAVLAHGLTRCGLDRIVGRT